MPNDVSIWSIQLVDVVIGVVIAVGVIAVAVGVIAVAVGVVVAVGALLLQSVCTCAGYWGISRGCRSRRVGFATGIVYGSSSNVAGWVAVAVAIATCTDCL